MREWANSDLFYGEPAADVWHEDSVGHYEGERFCCWQLEGSGVAWEARQLKREVKSLERQSRGRLERQKSLRKITREREKERERQNNLREKERERKGN